MSRLGLEGEEYLCRGRGVVLKRLRVTRPQVLGVGLNRFYCAAWRAALRRRRLAELRQAGQDDNVEASKLRAHLAGAPVVSEDVLRRWLSAIRRRRGARWRDWVEGQRARGGGAIYRWMQRLGPDVGLSGMGGEGTNEARVEAGWEAWSGLWAGGAEVQAVPTEAEALEPIPPETLREALRRMSPRKSRGVGKGWGLAGGAGSGIRFAHPEARGAGRGATSAHRYSSVCAQGLDGGSQGRVHRLEQGSSWGPACRGGGLGGPGPARGGVHHVAGPLQPHSLLGRFEVL